MLLKSKLGAICFLKASSRFLLLFSTRKEQAKNIPTRVPMKGNLGQVVKQNSARKSIEVLLASRAADSRGSTKPLKRVEKWACRTFLTPFTDPGFFTAVARFDARLTNQDKNETCSKNRTQNPLSPKQWHLVDNDKDGVETVYSDIRQRQGWSFLVGHYYR